MFKLIRRWVSWPVAQILMMPSFRFYAYARWVFSLMGMTARERFFFHAMDYVRANKMRGDYLEFGVGRGYSMRSAFHFAQAAACESMRFFGFDSFRGYPDLSGCDAEPQHYICRDFVCDEESVKRSFMRWRLDMKKVQTVPGWFADTLNNHTRRSFSLQEAAVVMIDISHYASSKQCLDFVTPHIQDGTVICFGGWFLFMGNPEYGEQKAFAEWLRENPQFTASDFLRYDARTISFIIHKRNDVHPS